MTKKKSNRISQVGTEVYIVNELNFSCTRHKITGETELSILIDNKDLIYKNSKTYKQLLFKDGYKAYSYLIELLSNTMYEKKKTIELQNREIAELQDKYMIALQDIEQYK